MSNIFPSFDPNTPDQSDHNHHAAPQTHPSRPPSNQSVWPASREFYSVLAGILLLGVFLRLCVTSYGLPLLLHEDEPIYYHHALQLGLGNWPTDYFKKPGFFLSFYAFFYTIGYWFSGLTNWKDYIAAFWEDPTYVVMIGRTISTLMAGSTIWVAGNLGRRLFGALVGLAFALWLAVDPRHFSISAVVISDIPSLLCIALSAWFALDVFDKGRLKDYILCALCITLAISFKYNVFTIVFLLAAHFAGRWPETASFQGFPKKILHLLQSRSLWIALACIPIIFTILNPMSVLHFGTFWHDLIYEKNHMLQRQTQVAEPLTPMIAFKPIFFRILPKTIGWTPYVFGLAGLLGGLWRASPRQKVVFAFPMLFLMVVLQFQLINAKYLLPVYLFWYLAAAACLMVVLKRVFRSTTVRASLFVVFTLLIAYFPAREIWSHLQIYSRPDTREVVAKYLNQLSKPKDHVLLERDSLTMDPDVLRSDWRDQVRSQSLRGWEQVTESPYPAAMQGELSKYRFIVITLSNANKRKHPAPGESRYFMPYSSHYYDAIKKHYRLKELVAPYPLYTPRPGYWQCQFDGTDLGTLYDRIQKSRYRRDMPGPVLLLMERF